MRDVINDIDRWQAEDESVAIATVVETWGSAPRGVGAKMALTAEGQISGSVSGGCVEGAVFEAGTEVLESGQPQLLHFGVADDTAWDVGLACGGTIDVFVERLDPVVYSLQRGFLDEEESFATVTVIGGPAEKLDNLRRDYDLERTIVGEAVVEAAAKALSESWGRRRALLLALGHRGVLTRQLR